VSTHPAPHTLITFLGRASMDPRTGYRTARYRFADGSVRETPFFGLALTEYLTPGRLVVLGTPGSMWDVLIEHLARDRAGTFEEQRLALAAAAESLSVDEEHLEALRPLAEEALGRACDLVLIEYGRDLEGQTRLLDTLYEVVGRERALHFDITHGLRHLSMLALVACHYLEAMARNLSVEQIWYGAFELRGPAGEVPVLELGGLSVLQRWVQALDHFEREGDYGAFADLLEREGVATEQADLLRQAAFFEGVLNLPEAGRRLKGFLDLLEREPLPGAARLFARRLRERIDWVRRGDLYEHQRRLAHLHLAKGDYLRAAILGNEAVLTRWMIARGEGDVNRQPDRERARAGLLGEMREARRDAEADDFRTLEALRNALAHGSVPEWRRTRELLQSSTRLGPELERLLSRLLS
jgi:CRISPR-associated Csx2 family protein